MLIKLTTHETVYVNKNHIVLVETNTTKKGSVVRLITGEKLQTQETLEDIAFRVNGR